MSDHGPLGISCVITPGSFFVHCLEERLYEIDKERKVALVHLVEDLIVDYVEAGVCAKEILKHEAEWLYRTTGHRLKLRGLFPSFIGVKPERESMNKDVVFYKKAGEVIPLELLQQAAKTFTTGIRYCMLGNGHVVQGQQVCTADPKNVFDQLTVKKDEPVLFSFYKEDKVSSEADQQPLVVVPDHFTIFLHGDFSEFEVDKMNSRPGAILAFEQKIRKKLVREWTSAGATPDSFMEYLANNEDIVTEIEMTIPSNAIMIMFWSNGKFQVIENTDYEQETPWGYIYGDPTGSGGGQEQTQDTKETEPAKATGGFSSFAAPSGAAAASATPAAPQASPTTPKASSGRQIEPRPAGVPLAIWHDQANNVEREVNIPNDKPWIRCPEFQDNGKRVGKQENKSWHLKHFNKVPKNWGARPLWPLDLDITLKSDPLAAAVGKTDTSVAALSTADPVKNVIPIPPVSPTKAAVEGFQKEVVNKFFGEGGRAVPSPETYMGLDKDRKNLGIEAGLTWEQVACIPHTVRHQIAVRYPDYASYLMGDLGGKVLRLMAREKELEENGLAMEIEIEELKKPKAAPAGFSSFAK